jgi:hypothetical protein
VYAAMVMAAEGKLSEQSMEKRNQLKDSTASANSGGEVIIKVKNETI